MKNKVFLTFIFAMMLLTIEAQNIRHDQLQEPEQETSDSLIFYIHDTEGYWRLGKGILDTSMVRYIEAYATIERLNDSVVVLRGEIPTLLTELDSTGFRVDYGQLMNVPAFLTSETDPVYAGDSAYIKSHIRADLDTDPTNEIQDISGIATNQQAIIDTASNIRADIPTNLTDLDSTGFDIDTSQVRDLQTFVENNSGSSSISGTEGYLPKFGASGLTESVVYEETSGSSTILVAPNSAIFGNTKIRADGSVIINNRGTGNRHAFVDFKGDDTYQSPLRIIRNNTGADANSDIIHRGTGGFRLRIIEAAPIQFYTTDAERMRITPTGNVGIGKIKPSEKLEVKGNIKADTIKTIGIEASGDVVFDLASPEKFKINYGGSTIVESNAVFKSLVFHSAPWLLDDGHGTHPNQFPTIGQMMDSIATVGGAVNSVNAGNLVDVSNTTGSVTVNVDLSEAKSDNTFSSTDQLVYLSGTAAKKGYVSGLQTYMQDNLDFGSGGGMVYPSAGIPVSTGSSWGSSITNNSSNWNTAYGDKINSLSVTGTTTKTITLIQQDGGTVTGTFTDLQGSGGDMVYPAAGIAVSTGSAWGTSKASPSGIIVGTTDNQALTNKSVNGVTLSTAQGTTNFLRGDGTYASPSGVFDDITLDNTTNANKEGIIYKGTTPFIHDFNYGNNGTVTTAGYNTFVGQNAGNLTMGATATQITHASNNTATGYISLYSNTTGCYNTAYGVGSLYGNTTGHSNTGVGLNSLGLNTTGHSNIGVGLDSGLTLADGATSRTTGNYGIYLGRQAKASANGTTNEIVIGYNAVGKGSNTAVIGNSSLTALYSSGQLVPATLSSAPSSPVEGGIYFNKTDNHFYGYNGSTWKQLDN